MFIFLFFYQKGNSSFNSNEGALKNKKIQIVPCKYILQMEELPTGPEVLITNIFSLKQFSVHINTWHKGSGPNIGPENQVLVFWKKGLKFQLISSNNVFTDQLNKGF